MMPLSGWLMSNAKGYSVKLFGLVLPKLTPKNAFLAETAQLAHGYLAFMILFFISLHLFAVIKHFFYFVNIFFLNLYELFFFPYYQYD